MIHYNRCPLCECEHSQRVFTSIDHTVSEEAFEIVQCANCSLRYTQDVPDEDEIGAYYRSQAYISHSDTNKGLVNQLYHRVRKITLGSKRRLVERSTGLKRGALLDVGAGTGAFLNTMKTAGWTVTGIEPDPAAIANAASKYEMQLLSSDQLFRLPLETFDAITMWHVLEHVHRLHEYLEQLKLLLKPEGRLIIAVPNYTSFDASYYKSNWAAYDVPRHLYHFSPASMTMLMTAHGMTIEDRHPMWFDSFYVSLLSEKYKTGRSNLLKGFVTGLHSNLHALSNRRRASSLIYVARK